MQTILSVQTIDSPLNSLDAIVDFASASNSHLTVVVLGIAVSLPVMAYQEIPAYDWGELFDEKYQQAQERANEIRQRFANTNVSLTVISTCRDMSRVSDLVSKHALYADLLILPSVDVLSPAIHERCLDGGLFDAAIPVLVLPDDIKEAPQLRTTMAAWYPSPHTSRAVRSAVELLESDTEFHVVTVDPPEHTYGPNPGDDIATFLARKNLKVTVDRIDGGDQSVAAVLQQRSIDLDADLVVMGAHGHSKMREWLLGNNTREMLERCKKPLLLSH